MFMPSGSSQMGRGEPLAHILFCEISGFDAMMKDYDAEEITTLLNKIYQKMDEICDSSGVTKIETVGKTYVACTGIKESEMDQSAYVPKLSSAHRLLYCAFEFLSSIDQFILPDGKRIAIKNRIRQATNAIFLSRQVSP